MTIKELQKGPRYTAIDILTRVEAGDAYADVLLDKKLNELDGPDRALAMELVNGVLRWRIKVDWIIDCFSKIKTRKLEHRVLNALRLGVYQLLFLSRVPAHAAINESVNLVRLDGARKAGFVNAVLRMVDTGRGSITFPVLKREPVNYISVVFSHPAWLVERWIQRYGIKKAIELCQANLRVPPTTMRVNTLACTRDKLIEELAAEGIRTEPTAFSPDGITLVKEEKKKGSSSSISPTPDPRDKRFYIQDESSQLVAHLVQPGPGEAVLDGCAAPGGKTVHMACLMNNVGLIYGVDKHPSRVKTLKEMLRRFGITIVRTITTDAAKTLEFQQQSLALSVDTHGFTGLFDAVLVDAPCTALGVLRRNPDIKGRRIAGDIKEMAGVQRALLDNLSGLVRPGGRLVYSVCSTEPEETDDVVEGFLKAHTDFVVEDAADILPPACAPLVDKAGFLRTSPLDNGMDGFFAARLKRVPHAGGAVNENDLEELVPIED